MGRLPPAPSLCCTLAGAGSSVSGKILERFIGFLLCRLFRGKCTIKRIRRADTCWEETRAPGGLWHNCVASHNIMTCERWNRGCTAGLITLSRRSRRRARGSGWAENENQEWVFFFTCSAWLSFLRWCNMLLFFKKENASKYLFLSPT